MLSLLQRMKDKEILGEKEILGLSGRVGYEARKVQMQLWICFDTWCKLLIFANISAHRYLIVRVILVQEVPQEYLVEKDLK